MFRSISEADRDLMEMALRRTGEALELLEAFQNDEESTTTDTNDEKAEMGLLKVKKSRIYTCLWVKKKTPRDRRFWSIGFFWYPLTHSHITIIKDILFTCCLIAGFLGERCAVWSRRHRRSSFGPCRPLALACASPQKSYGKIQTFASRMGQSVTKVSFKRSLFFEKSFQKYGKNRVKE